MGLDTDRARPAALCGLAATAVAAGALIGATTNALNGALSPEYFRNVLGWHDVQDVWRASIAHGIFEGLIFGVAFSIVLSLVVGLVSRARCTYRFALRYLLAITAAVYGCWAVGGLIALGLASLSPEFYRNTFNGVPEQLGAMLCYAWVGGSIWGATSGAVLAGVIACIAFGVRWRRTQHG